MKRRNTIAKPGCGADYQSAAFPAGWQGVPRRARKRRGFTLLEVSVSMLMLAALTTICLHFFAAASDQRQQVFAHLAATQEAANLLERVEALGWNELATARPAKVQISLPAQHALPEGRAEMF